MHQHSSDHKDYESMIMLFITKSCFHQKVEGIKYSSFLHIGAIRSVSILARTRFRMAIGMTWAQVTVLLLSDDQRKISRKHIQLK